MSKYEFSAKQNEKFAELSTRLKHFAIFFGLAGFVFISSAAVNWADGTWQQALPNILGGISVIVGAYFFYRPLDNFRSIIETEGRDVEELMRALGDLNLAYGFMQFTLGALALFVFANIILASMG